MPQEVITYPWVGDASLAAIGLDKAHTVRFDGAPAPDRESLRPSLVPNLIEAAAANLRYRSTVEIFEVSVTVRPAEGTLTGETISACREAALDRLAESTGAHLRQ